ncbi:MAG: hypothetical protein BMS9Abin34_083 [Patescibacteria group bacterium]|nr:MAG: hypothetical protein BMS9Abin34_083 [Patescibacteria group bacterium]
MSKKIFVVLFFLIVLAQVVVVNSLIVKGRETQELLAEKKLLQSRLLELENEAARASSLESIRGQAEKLGMKPGKLQYLPPVPVALAPQQ